MISSIEEFDSIYGKYDIVNYDMEKVYGYGVTYKSSKNVFEEFRKENGEYITFPKIQPYLTLTNSNYSMFIIKNNKMFKLRRGDENHPYVIDREINVDLRIFDNIFKNEDKIKKSAARTNEPIYTIE